MPKSIFICDSCGKTFETYAKPSNHHFCSRTCFHKFTPWNKGKPWSEEIRQKLHKPHPNMKGNGNPRWKSGRSIEVNGYVTIWTPEGRMAEHRYIMEQYLGRKLLSTEIVHHKNKNRQDNRLENLEITTISNHLSHHNSGDDNWQRQIGCRVTVNCILCGKAFSKKKSQTRKFCSHICYHKSRRNKLV